MQKVEVTCPRSMICAVMTQKSVPAQSTCAHTHTEIDSHSDIQIHMPSDMHADIHRDTREHIPAYIHRYTQAQTLKDTHTHRHERTHCCSHQHPFPIRVFPSMAHTLPVPLLWGRASPSRKTSWLDSLPWLSALHRASLPNPCTQRGGGL